MSKEAKDEALKLVNEYRPSMNSDLLHLWAKDMQVVLKAMLATPPAAAQPAPVREDWGPGPHEYHSLPAPVRERVACKPLCELCVKRGYDFCANAAKTTPLPTPPAAQQEHEPENEPFVSLASVQEPVAYRSLLASGSYTYCTTPQFFDNAQPLYTTPPAAPTVQEGRDWSLLEATQESLREHMTEIKRLKEAQPAVPDALTSADIQEHIEYVAGWNDCRAEMLKGMKP
jgi:hypothetical protein